MALGEWSPRDQSCRLAFHGVKPEGSESSISTVDVTTDAAASDSHDQALDVATVYSRHADFVWKSLFRLGVRDADLEDVVQEVFIVVHRRIASYDGSARVTTWLFGIAMRVASAYHRRAYRRRERPADIDPGSLVAPLDSGPEQCAVDNQARGQLERILAHLDVEKRATFVLFEIDNMSCAEIAALTDVPIGTVYSRLHAARAVFTRELARQVERNKAGTP